MEDNNIIVSFCIPTYNNIASAERLILSILECENVDIEVVVLDNGSTDGTLKILGKIDDARLNIYSNGVNKGALFNMINVLDKGRGKYLVYCTDHDFIDNTKIENFLDFFLNNSSVAFGYCEYDLKNELLFNIYKSGSEALSKLAYITRHPTGMFFKREFWKLRDCVNRFSDSEFVDLFPLEFVFAELSLLGDGAIYYDSIFMPETGKSRVRKHKSATTDGKLKTAFFSPHTRLKLAVNFERHLQSLDIPKRERNQVAIKSFFRELHTATIVYKQIMLNDAICEHYYMKRRVVGNMELVKTAFTFYNGYIGNVFKMRPFVDKVEFKLNLISTIIRKIVNKL